MPRNKITTCVLLLILGHWGSAIRLCSKANQNHLESINPQDGLNSKLPVTEYGWPQCHQSREEQISLANDLLDVSFVLIKEEVLVLEDHSFHQEYCLVPHSKQENKTLAYICQTKVEILCLETNCTRKCCQLGQVYDKGSNQCVPKEANLSTDDDDNLVSKDVSKTFYGAPKNCPHQINVGSNFSMEHSFLKVDNTKYGIEEYCLLDLIDGSTEAQLCLSITQDRMYYARIKSISMIISLIFLNLAGILVWRNHKEKLFGSMTLMLIANLFISYSTFLVMDLVPALNDKYCQIFPHLLQFSQLSAVWWMNSMCVDIWQTFRTLKAVPQVSVKYGFLHPEFLPHACWATFMPLAVTLVTVFVEHLFNFYHDTVQGCAMTYNGILYYLIVPMIPVLFVTLVCFIITSTKLCCGLWSTTTAEDQPTTETLKSVKIRIKSVVKIFIATGITWVAEIIGWCMHFFVAESEKDHAWIVKVTLPLDLINALQGLTLFLALVPNYSVPLPYCKFRVYNPFTSCKIQNPFTSWYRKWKDRKRQMYNLEMDAVDHHQTHAPSFRQKSFNEC